MDGHNIQDEDPPANDNHGKGERSPGESAQGLVPSGQSLDEPTNGKDGEESGVTAKPGTDGQALKYLEEYVTSAVTEEISTEQEGQEHPVITSANRRSENEKDRTVVKDDQIQLSQGLDHPATSSANGGTENEEERTVVNADQIPSSQELDATQGNVNPEQEGERDDSETDEADEGSPLEDDGTVRIVLNVESSQIESTAAEEVPSAVTVSNAQMADENKLRRSRRKRRRKKRGYEDDDRSDNTSDQAEEDDEGGSSVSKTAKSTEGAPDCNQPFICDICERSYTTPGQYKAHLRTHSEQRPHQCVFCHKQFRQKCQKDKHERVHTGEKPYKCGHCDRAFSENGSRRRHERIHSGSKPYACSHCDRRFIQKGNKDAHEKTHTGYKPFKCPRENCNDTFASETELQLHHSIHPQRPYKCHFCCKSFPFNTERKRHERCHTGVRPYKCDYCNKSFTQKGNKDSHEKTHTGTKPHNCRYCKKLFSRRQYLAKHIEKKHAEEERQTNLPSPTVYAVLEVGAELAKDRLMAESLLKAAHMVASSSLAADQIDRVMAEVNERLLGHQGAQQELRITASGSPAKVTGGKIVVAPPGSHGKIGQMILEMTGGLTGTQVAVVDHQGGVQQLQMVERSTGIGAQDRSCSSTGDGSCTVSMELDHQGGMQQLQSVDVSTGGGAQDHVGGGVPLEDGGDRLVSAEVASPGGIGSEENQVVNIEDMQVIVGAPDMTEDQMALLAVVQPGGSDVGNSTEQRRQARNTRNLKMGKMQYDNSVDINLTERERQVLLNSPHVQVISTEQQHQISRPGTVADERTASGESQPPVIGGNVREIHLEHDGIHLGRIELDDAGHLQDPVGTRGGQGDEIAMDTSESTSVAKDDQPTGLSVQFDQTGKPLVIHGHKIIVEQPRAPE